VPHTCHLERDIFASGRVYIYNSALSLVKVAPDGLRLQLPQRSWSGIFSAVCHWQYITVEAVSATHSRPAALDILELFTTGEQTQLYQRKQTDRCDGQTRHRAHSSDICLRYSQHCSAAAAFRESDHKFNIFIMYTVHSMTFYRLAYTPRKRPY